VRRPTGADRRRFSYIWDERVPVEATMPGGPVVTRFVIRIDRRTAARGRNRVALIRAPRACPPRPRSFRLTTEFAGAAAEVTRDTVRCRS